MEPLADFEKLQSNDPKVKYGYAKELVRIASEEPGSLYPHFDNWVELMSSHHQILQWTAIDIIGYLSGVDSENRIGKPIVENLIRILHGGILIPCNHAIFSLGLIAKNKPEYRKRILAEFLTVPNDTFKTEECKNIATGKILDALKPFAEEIKNDTAFIRFIEKASANARKSTQKRADQLRKKIKK